jgi:hypothetical protein
MLHLKWVELQEIGEEYGLLISNEYGVLHLMAIFWLDR